MNSHLYVQWDEEGSDEPQGWYLAKVTSVSADGTATVLYRKGRMLESINHSKTNWFPAPGNGKWYLPSPPPTATITNTKQSKTHKVKGYADDLSVFSSSMKDHAAALQTIDKHCSDLDLRLKPSKCVSFIYNGKKVLRNVTFPLKEGSTKNICTGPNKFLGHTLCHTLPATAKESGKRFMNSFLEKLDSLDTSPIRGEYKLWILRRFLIPSFHFVLSVDVIPDSSIKKVQSQCTKKIKGWLGLTRGVTNAVIHHPNVIDIPTIAEYRTKAKLIFLSSILTSKDPVITEISELLLDQDFTRSQCIPSEVNQVLDLAKNSISTITTKTMSRKCTSVHRDSRVKHWNDKLSELTVQCKFTAITELESQNNVWRRIQKGMPAGQLSFLLRAGSDTLPTPLN